MSNPGNKKNLLLAVAAFALFGGTIAVVLKLFYNPQEDLVLKPDDTVLVAAGKVLYKENCAACHGKNLEGQPNWKSRNEAGRLPAPPHDQSGHTWHHADALLFEITKFGLKNIAGPDYQSDMPVYKDNLSDEQIIAVLSFIKSTWPKKIRVAHDGINIEYRKKKEVSR